MNRTYEQGSTSTATFFVGKEIEHTPAYGQQTLFVVGLHPTWEVSLYNSNCTHIFFGANHSFNPKTIEEQQAWEDMITHYLKKDFLCSLDIPISHVEEFNEGGLCEYNNFIPQIRVPISYINLWNYNTMIKIDDRGFNETNPGIWTHRLHNLQDPGSFTAWQEYKQDKILK